MAAGRRIPLHEKLWQANVQVAEACLAHPFIRAMREGTLDEAAFKRYIAQDAFFLDAFARAYALAMARSRDAAAMKSFKGLLQAVIEEKKMHARAAERMGILLDGVKPLAATRTYTDFLLATAARAGAGETTAAMTPCMRLYAYLGDQLRQEVGDWALKDHPYREWIETYSSREFHAAAAELEGLLDRLAADTPDVRRAYRYAMECEREFFSAPLVDRTNVTKETGEQRP